MFHHVRANLLLLCLTLLLCSVLYPLTLWAFGQAVVPFQANGSLVTDAQSQPIGSRLIAQPFTGDEYFQPRPSSVSYNASASGGSNYGASNPRLRGRVAQQLGTIVRYLATAGPGKGALVGEDVEKWFQKENDPGKGDRRRDLASEWARSYPSLIAGWATSSDLTSDYLKRWAQEHPETLKAWKLKNAGSNDPPRAEELALFFFNPQISDSFVRLHPGMWPCTVEEERDGKKIKFIKPDNQGDDIRSIFFDLWLQDHRDAKLEPVPADLVMASGSGLDPHITLKNALYQLHTRIAVARADKLVHDRVEDLVQKRAERVTEAQRREIDEQVRRELTQKVGKPLEAKVHEAIEDLLQELREAPLGGLAGVPCVNVLEVNRALSERMNRLAQSLSARN